MGDLRHGGTIYDRIRWACEEKFGKEITDAAIAEKIGVSKHLISKWKNGKSRPNYDTLGEISKATGMSLDYFVTGSTYGLHADKINHESYEYFPAYNRPEESIPAPLNSATYQHEPLPDPVNFILEAKNIPVVGAAAADETKGRKAGFFPLDPDAYFDELTLPETTAAVKIIGNSMSPVLLDGQYAIIGPEYILSSSHPGNYDIVVAKIEVVDEDQAGSDRRWEGVYCKRIVDGGDVWFLLSISSVGVPFTIAKSNCRLWPVIGVYFAGKGRPPEED